MPALADIEAVKQEFQIGAQEGILGLGILVGLTWARVFVAGSINMDVVATAARHPRIGETVAGKEVLYFPGGKGANQAVAAAKLGAPTTLIGRLGATAFGTELKAFLAAQGIDLSFVQGDRRGSHRDRDRDGRQCR